MEWAEVWAEGVCQGSLDIGPGFAAARSRCLPQPWPEWNRPLESGCFRWANLGKNPKRCVPAQRWKPKELLADLGNKLLAAGHHSLPCFPIETVIRRPVLQFTPHLEATPVFGCKPCLAILHPSSRRGLQAYSSPLSALSFLPHRSTTSTPTKAARASIRQAMV